MQAKVRQYNKLLSVFSKIKSRFFLIIISILLISCSKENIESPISGDRIERLSKGTNFNDIFVSVDSVQLEVTPQSLIAFLGVVAVDSKGRIAASDGRQSQVLMFSENGKFLKLIATKGSGPGEVEKPEGLAFFEDGSLAVADVGNNRINVYSNEGKFERSFRVESPRPSRIIFDSIGNIFVQVPSRPGGNAIQKYDQNGKLVDEFGKVPNIGMKIGMNIAGGNFIEYKDLYIYYVHPTEYLIQQFKLDGKRVRAIKQKSERSRPLKSAPTAFDPQSFKKWQQSWDPVHTVLTTAEGFLLVIYQATQVSPDTVINVIDLYDVEGKLIVEDIRTSYLPVCVDGQNTIYCLDQRLRFIQENPILFLFKIRT